MTAFDRADSHALLAAHARRAAAFDMRQMFAADPGRAERLSVELPGLLVDFSKQRVDDDALRLLIRLARETGVTERRDAMFRGDRINVTEGRAVLHTALRAPAGSVVMLDGRNVVPDVQDVLGRMAAFSRRVRDRDWLGHTGRPIEHVVNIGIGGSDLGPYMACEALMPYGHPRLSMHFVSNVDATHIVETLKRVDPETTLFIVASKTFTTQETLANARTAREWFLGHAGNADAIARHFVAVSTNAAEVSAFGIDPTNMFGFWDWVGGRYSLWSAIGLPLMLYVGPEAFGEFLAGGHAMDLHFRDAPPEANVPMLMALVGLWNANFLGCDSVAVIPYDQYLHRLPAYLQQLDMESNGKGTTLSGTRPGYSTGPVIWGEPGTNGQHAFFQLLHQGTRTIPVDFIVPVHSHHDAGEHHAMLLANCLAQSQALMLGKNEAEVSSELAAQGLSDDAAAALLPHKVFLGNRPSTTLMFDRMTPHALGMLIALYEHKVFVQGAVWGVNSFDQWGVELGKQLAGRILADLRDGRPAAGHDASTAWLLGRVIRARRPG